MKQASLHIIVVICFGISLILKKIGGFNRNSISLSHFILFLPLNMSAWAQAWLSSSLEAAQRKNMATHGYK